MAILHLLGQVSWGSSSSFAKPLASKDNNKGKWYNKKEMVKITTITIEEITSRPQNSSSADVHIIVLFIVILLVHH